jgi:LytTr DNA-binding domain
LRFALREWGTDFVNRLRRGLLEIWAVLPLAVVVGFLGPFGTYLSGDFLLRVGRWWFILMIAYVVSRPLIEFWRWLALQTGLPQGSMVFWGSMLSSFPMALIWRVFGREEVRMLGGYTGLLPFALLCSAMVLVVVWWAKRADDHLLVHYPATLSRLYVTDAPPPVSSPSWPGMAMSQSGRPRLHDRLPAGFDGAVLALESEDHYVRVHGAGQSELLLMRLRDAIAEMDAVPGEQTHRSWWVARGAVAIVDGNGRNREIRLINGVKVPVARDSVDRLQRAGFLPA